MSLLLNPHPGAPISQVCEAVGLTPRAVRFYEQRGLLKAQRDEQNFRRYPPEARRRLALIAALRSAGVSLSSISVLFETLQDDSEDAQESALRLLRGELSRLDDRRAALATMIEDLSSAHEEFAGRAARHARAATASPM